MVKNKGSEAGKGDTPGKQCNFIQSYVKGVSLEAPGVPGILFGHEQPVLQFDVSSTYKLSAEASAKLGDVYAVDVRVTVQALAGEQTLFLIEVEQGGLFNLIGYDADEKDGVLRTRAPEMLFPYARELVSSLVSRAGFPRLQLKPFDFEKGYLRAMQEYREAIAGMPGQA
ncbi:MAG: protein-export chaperone SecB [Gammaproteobacteria bacterium]|nr:protein-export chaperone SecB [Gammaproteobacteria bacterium]